jgi:hypothetical protein
VTEEYKRQRDFENGIYFSHLKLNNPLVVENKRQLAQAKLKGEFKMNLPKILSSDERVTALAHENMAYHIYKRGHFFKIVKEQQNTKERRESNHVERTNSIFKDF